MSFSTVITVKMLQNFCVLKLLFCFGVSGWSYSLLPVKSHFDPNVSSAEIISSKNVTVTNPCEI